MDNFVNGQNGENLGEQKGAPIFADAAKQKKSKKNARQNIKENQIVIEDLLNAENVEAPKTENVETQNLEKQQTQQIDAETIDKNVSAENAQNLDKNTENLAKKPEKTQKTTEKTENIQNAEELTAQKEADLAEVKQEDTEEEQLSEANQAVAKQKSKKKKILTLIFFIINIAVIAFIIVKQTLSGEISSIGELFVGGKIKWGYFLLGVLLWAFIMVLDTCKTTYLIKKSTGKTRPFLAYKTGVIGRYYDNITPMSTGGQPFQIYYLTNRGLSGSAALSVTMARYVIDQIAWIMISLLAILVAIFHFGSRNIVSVASYIGFGLNFAVVFAILIISINQKVGKTLVAKVFKLLHKMKIIKNYEKHYDSVMRTVNNFQTTMKKYSSNLKDFIGIIFLEFVENLLIFCTNIFVLLMFGGTLTWDIALQLVVFNVLIGLASGFMPLPGGTGVAELSFPALFKDIFPAGTIGWAMLVNRLFNYYGYLLQGVCVVVYDYAIGNKRWGWQKRKWELEDESFKFKAEQLKRYKKRQKQKSL